MIAANNGHCAAVEALLENGADPSMCSEAGWSALTFAAHKVCFLCILDRYMGKLISSPFLDFWIDMLFAFYVILLFQVLNGISSSSFFHWTGL